MNTDWSAHCMLINWIACGDAVSLPGLNKLKKPSVSMAQNMHDW